MTVFDDLPSIYEESYMFVNNFIDVVTESSSFSAATPIVIALQEANFKILIAISYLISRPRNGASP
jgi:hypothetical protein